MIQLLSCRPFSFFALLASFLILPSCGRDTQPVVVDFYRVIKAEKSNGQSSATPPLRVAVAAMVSPKETFSAYGRLLDYIGHRTGRETELIQRKTYQEISELLGIPVGTIKSRHRS